MLAAAITTLFVAVIAAAIPVAIVDSHPPGAYRGRYVGTSRGHHTGTHRGRHRGS